MKRTSFFFGVSFRRSCRSSQKCSVSAFFGINGWGIDMDYCDIEWFALETNSDHSVIFEIVPMYSISDSSVDYESYSISSKGFLPTVVDIMVIWVKFTHFSSLIPKILMFTLATSCLTTSNLPWFMDLTFQVPMQYCSLQHWTFLLSPVTSTTRWCFCFGSVSSFFLELFLHYSPVAYWAPTDLGSSSFSVLFCLFILFRLKWEEVRKTTRAFRYDLNQITYDHTVEVTNRFKGLDLIDRVWRTMDGGSLHCTEGSDQDHPQEKEIQKGKMIVLGRLTNSYEKERSERQRRKRKIYPFDGEFQGIARREIRKPSSAINAKNISRPTEWERLQISSEN